jgi:hypothetical protein
MKKYKELCNRRIFDKSYWGQFELLDDEENEISILAYNRDLLAIQYDLVSYIKPRIKPNFRIFDHVELYRTESGKVVMFTSLYSSDDLSKYGLKTTYKIYSESATTWCRVFDNLVEYNRFCRGTL